MLVSLFPDENLQSGSVLIGACYWKTLEMKVI